MAKSQEQGQQYGMLSAEQREIEISRKKTTKALQKAVDDDYLCGPLSVETYVMFRCVHAARAS